MIFRLLVFGYFESSFPSSLALASAMQRMIEWFKRYERFFVTSHLSHYIFIHILISRDCYIFLKVVTMNSKCVT